MRNLNLTHSRPQAGQEARVAWLVRHLDARLRDFGPGGPEVLEADQTAGLVKARFPGHDPRQVLDRLARQGIQANCDGAAAVFHLSPDVPFEDLDYLWGCLFEILN